MTHILHHLAYSNHLVAITVFCLPSPSTFRSTTFPSRPSDRVTHRRFATRQINSRSFASDCRLISRISISQTCADRRRFNLHSGWMALRVLSITRSTKSRGTDRSCGHASRFLSARRRCGVAQAGHDAIVHSAIAIT